MHKEARRVNCFLLSTVLFGHLLFLACPSRPAEKPTAKDAGSISTPKREANVAFDADRAFAHVSKLVAFGPRPAGSAELARAREYIIGELRSYGLKTWTDEFTAQTPIGPRRMANVVAELGGQSRDVIIIASHYDTKYYRKFRFVGANDGGSSTGAVLEIARVLAARHERPRFTYWFVFFDGEEAFCEGWTDCGTPENPDNTYGSRRFASRLEKEGELNRVLALVLLDLVGYKNLELARDTMSTRWLVDLIWQTAREMGYGNYFIEREEGIGGDDHVPFLQKGIEAVDIIQLSTYPYWHTPEDTLDKISPRSLKAVGDVVLASLPRIEQRLLNRRLR
ncbi:MAG: hypothetical protein C4334_11940 [Pyrinomonas sp.]